METYRTARIVHSVLIFVGWLTTGVSLLTMAIIFAKFGALGWISAGILLAIAMSGVLTVVVSQMGVAQIATAENTDRMVHLLRAALEAPRPDRRIVAPPLTRTDDETISQLRAPRRH
ncbi:hypothetical protein [Jannaschia donghaensis]|uniref:YiaA/B two helix domain protein n=1 Tax=Jannaschia donghaensis TaxID=420998 RepID=A0A0M6YMU2_9RHOB|nr:hypothetical protein [Jannaschia donghaensis]CTQ50975.1 hypothetical protein JDO7802_03006 [Jannaschia donghaensis]